MQALFHLYAQDRACEPLVREKARHAAFERRAQTAQRSAGQKPKDKKQPKGWFLQFPPRRPMKDRACRRGFTRKRSTQFSIDSAIEQRSTGAHLRLKGSLRASSYNSHCAERWRHCLNICYLKLRSWLNCFEFSKENVLCHMQFLITVILWYFFPNM